MAKNRKNNRDKAKETNWQERVIQIRRVSKVVKGCLLYTSPSPRDS